MAALLLATNLPRGRLQPLGCLPANLRTHVCLRKYPPTYRLKWLPYSYLMYVPTSFKIIAVILYLDKSLALIKCGIYNSVGKTFIYISIVFKIMLDHFIRIFYISNLLYNFLISSVIQDRCLYIIQLCSTFLLVFIFIFYRRHNSENIGPVFSEL